MEREEALIRNFREFYDEAVDASNKGRFTSAYILLFKALIAIADLLIFRKKGIIPKNHTQRFNILPYVNPELMAEISSFFEEYTNAYSPGFSIKRSSLT